MVGVSLHSIIKLIFTKSLMNYMNSFEKKNVDWFMIFYIIFLPLLKTLQATVRLNGTSSRFRTTNTWRARAEILQDGIGWIVLVHFCASLLKLESSDCCSPHNRPTQSWWMDARVAWLQTSFAKQQIHFNEFPSSKVDNKILHKNPSITGIGREYCVKDIYLHWMWPQVRGGLGK